MNLAQKEQVINLLKEFDGLNFLAILAEKFKDEGDFSNVIVRDITLDEYIVLVNKVIKHFLQEFQGINYISLPFSYNYGSEIGSANLQSDLQNLINYIRNEDFNSSVVPISRLATYQRANGFWEFNTRKMLRTTERKIQEGNDILEAKKAVIESRLSELNNYNSVFNSNQNRVQEFLDEKIAAFKVLESSMQNIITQSDNINNMFANTTSTVEKINSLLAISESRRVDADKLHEESKIELVEIKDNLKSFKEEYSVITEGLKGLNTEFTGVLDFVKNKNEYFVARNKYLDDLIGREVGASLFETFKQRKNELSPSVHFWKWAVPVFAFATVLWIFLLFSWSSDQPMSYQLLIINSIKALPALGLLLFGIKQYGKERNFQEEYAFKSAVALTLNSYAEQLQNVDNKDALILASVSSIYKSPIHHTKIKLEDGKGMMDSMSELLGKVKDINKK